MPEEKEDKGFKVIDRRGVEATPEPPSPPPSPPPVETPGSSAASEGVPRFLDLVQSLQMGAMVGLGMLPGPGGKSPPVDLPAAKDAIDLLGILQEKTKGNLTKEEEEVLREGLYHLRMGYMAMINAPPVGAGKGGDQR
jgi:hypothetical protein